ncbi:MAG: CvpA family protein [Candidatus Omnitrophota bacterium]
MIDAIMKFNFLDILIILLAMRICYKAFQMGLAVELFKLLGTIFAVYIALHYYTILSDMLGKMFMPKEMPLEFLDFLIFIILAVGGYLGFVALRSIFYRFMKLEALPQLNQFGGLVLGIIRLFFTVGLLTYILMISSVKYLNEAVKYSVLGSKSVTISTNAYTWLWNNVTSKFSPNEKFNPTVEEVSKRFKAK